METYIAYFDETGDDGAVRTSSSTFVLTSMYMSCTNWQSNYDKVHTLRRFLKDQYGLFTSEEIHTKHFLTNKDPYRKYGWSIDDKRLILKYIVKCIMQLDVKYINVIIDKNNIIKEDYDILGTALKYNIQRIDNDSNGEWNYIIITDRGRVAPMRKTAREIRAFNPIHSKYEYSYTNKPIRNLIEDILEKDSRESHFIQLCDFVSYFVHLYYKTHYLGESIPNRAKEIIDEEFISSVMDALHKGEVFNEKASQHEYGLVIYPQR